MAKTQTLFEFRSANWQLCRIECMVRCVTEYWLRRMVNLGGPPASQKFWRKRSKPAQDLHATAGGSNNPPSLHSHQISHTLGPSSR
jgi:hypothetical protein